MSSLDEVYEQMRAFQRTLTDILQGTRSAQLFKSYAATPALHGDQSAEGLVQALRSLYPAERQGVAAP